MPWAETSPGIWYRRENGTYRLLVHQPDDIWCKDFSYTPGYFTCLLGEPWYPCDRWGEVTVCSPARWGFPMGEFVKDCKW